MENPIISVIVPIYKVEDYLDECICSIVNQTYRNLEIILVDDGSPDNCGKICDEWAKKDNRIKVIHKMNGGLSSARNAGLDNATGEYIQFVDSDDYIASTMTGDLLVAIKERNADMAIGGIVTFYYDNFVRIERYRFMNVKQPILSGKEILQNISEENYYMYDMPTVIVCNKLYRKEIFQDIRFPVGKLSEDNFIIHRLYRLNDTIAIVNVPHYYYRQRIGSIMHDDKLSKKRRVGITLAIADRARYYHEQGLCQESLYFFHMALYSFVNNYRKNKQTLDKQSFKELSLDFKSLLQEYKKREDVSKKNKIEFTIFSISPFLHYITFGLLRKIRNHRGDKHEHNT